MKRPPPPIGVLETVLYFEPERADEVHSFYREVLGLEPTGMGGSAFRIGSGVILLFDPASSSSQDDPPPHGARGPVHVCFVVPPDSYESWQEYLEESGVATRAERTWPNGARSFYFDDPAGNVLEIADGDLWT